ncbi:MAG: TenA family protein [Gammaproteobacteria bacterium]|nr:TenA family protein [Gammaproteobacteria bacterium]
MKYSAKAWEKVAPIYKAVIQHPFNQELMKGTLSQEKFIYYIEQDILFLNELSGCLALIASKIQPEHSNTFLELAHSVSLDSEAISKQYRIDTEECKKNHKLSRATLSYTSYLWRTSAVDPVEVAVAAILPSYWVYYESNVNLSQSVSANNPYLSWIERFTTKEFDAEVKTVIAIFDALAENTTEENRKKMLEAFCKSAMLEWHFWNDVYEAIIFEKV